MAYGIHSDVAQDQFGNAVANASVVVRSVAGGAVVANPLATIYTASSSIGATPVAQANPMTTDALGRFSFGAPDGFYAIDISGSNFPSYRVYRNLVAAYLPGAGGVSSVALALPGEFTVTGGPIVNTGTLTGTWTTQTANKVFAGPTSGGAVTPAFRALVAADFPASGVAPAAYQSLNIGSGALVLTTFTVDAYGRVTTTSNTSTTIPLLSAQGTWTKAQNVASVALSFGDPLVTDATQGNAFHTTATSNFVFQNPTGLVSGGTYIWRIQQNAAGSKLITSFGTMFKFPGGIVPTLSTPANSVDVLVAYYDGTNLLCNLNKAYA
jgi:hypothetical protein